MSSGKKSTMLDQEATKLAVLTAYPRFQVRKQYRGEDGSTYRAYDGRTWKAKVISPPLASRKRVIDYVAAHLPKSGIEAACKAVALSGRERKYDE